MSDNFFEMPGFREQLQADKTTLEMMLEDQKIFTEKLNPEAGDPLEYKETRASVRLFHDNYLRTLEEALRALEQVLEYKPG